MSAAGGPRSGDLVAYVDAQAGAAGDMLLGALVGLGVPTSFFEDVACRMGLAGVRVSAQSVRRSGIQGWQVTVDPASAPRPKRHLADILVLLESARLAPPVVAQARSVFETLARAEAAVHGASVDHVHFHEVGAVDSIVDVVGVVAGLHSLGVHRVVASSLPLGPGTVTFSHGTHALPAPAVAELCTGMLVHGVDAGGGETVTPTAAALLRVLAAEQGPLPALRVVGHGRGAGTADRPQLANLLRIFVGHPPAAEGAVQDHGHSHVVAAAVDDMNPQHMPLAFEHLLEAGAADVHATPILMKKGRPGFLVEALCPAGRSAAVIEAMLRHTSSLGCRVTSVHKHAAERTERVVATRYGEIPVKLAWLGEELLRCRPEHDVVAAAASQHGVSAERVAAEVQARLAAEDQS